MYHPRHLVFKYSPNCVYGFWNICRWYQRKLKQLCTRLGRTQKMRCPKIAHRADKRRFSTPLSKQAQNKSFPLHQGHGTFHRMSKRRYLARGVTLLSEPMSCKCFSPPCFQNNAFKNQITFSLATNQRLSENF